MVAVLKNSVERSEEVTGRTEEGGDSVVGRTELDTVLCVDLDNTLLKTDLLHESYIRLLRGNPLYLFISLIWLLQGRAVFKRQIAKRVQLDPATLPYNQRVLELLSGAKRSGRRVALATASDELLAVPIARHVGLFDQVFASDGVINLKGAAKREILKDNFGPGGFDYVGDSYSDLKIWELARTAIVVSSNRGLIDLVRSVSDDSRILPGRRLSVRTLLKAIRVHQWVKNLLLFLPAIMAQRIVELEVLFGCIGGYIAFCFCASSVYLVNDLLDLDSDRSHRSKCRRPFAAGELPLLAGAILVPLLLTVSTLLCLFLPMAFSFTLMSYFAITLAYSFKLKSVPLVDILVLASLYTIRVLAGGTAVSIEVSTWLLAFSMFMFLSLAGVKRFSELYRLRREQKSYSRGRGYVSEDLEMISQFGAASGYLSALVLALYINSPDVSVFYSRPKLLWLLCPLVLYWIGRVWLLAHRGELHEDPIVFAIKDRASYVVGILSLLMLVLAI